MASQNSAPNPKEEIAQSYKYMEIYFKAAVSINAVPYCYNKRNRQFTFNRDTYKYKLWLVLMVFGMVAETVQVATELVRGSLDANMTRGQWCLVLFIFISWVFVFFLHYTVYCYGEDIVSYVNQALGVREYFRESNLPPTNDHRVVKAHIYVSCAQCFFQALMVAAEGDKAQYLFSNLLEEYRNPLTWTMWILYAYYRVMSNFLAGYFQYFVGVLHVQTCKQILMFRQQRKKSTDIDVQSYRMVQILSKRFNYAFAHTFVPNITVMAVANIILGNYGTIRFVHDLDFNLYANFPLMSCMMLLFTLTFYPSNGALKEMSEMEPARILAACLKPKNQFHQLVNEVKAERVTDEVAPQRVEAVRRLKLVFELEELAKWNKYKVARRLARSCPIVSVRMSAFCPIKRTTALRISDFIWYNTISALLTWA